MRTPASNRNPAPLGEQVAVVLCLRSPEALNLTGAGCAIDVGWKARFCLSAADDIGVG